MRTISELKRIGYKAVLRGEKQALSRLIFKMKLRLFEGCPERDSNSYILTNATPSRWCVYQFRHLGFCLEVEVLNQTFNLRPHFKLGVPEERLELSRDNSQRLLRPQRLPISPSGLIYRRSLFNPLIVQLSSSDN